MTTEQAAEIIELLKRLYSIGSYLLGLVSAMLGAILGAIVGGWIT